MEWNERPPSSAARELQSVIKTYITLEMKALLILALALVGSGCTTSSKYVNDPRAAAVGPAYLDYIDEYPRDRDTQFYYPLFGVRDYTSQADYTISTSAEAAEFKPFLTQIPPASEEVKEITGKGWPELERTGKPF
jgi:hypothetical protein